MIEAFTHVGHVVKDIQQGIELYTKFLGARPTAPVQDIPGGKVIMIPVGNNGLELIQPTDPTTRIGQFLEKRGEGLFHISFRVDDIAAHVRALRQQGITVDDPIEISSLPHRPIIAFLDASSTLGAIIELAEEPTLKRR